MDERTCDVDGCQRRTRNVGAEHCRMHHYRMEKFGSTDKPKNHARIDRKVCRGCGYEGDAFYAYLKSTCIPCYRAYQRAYDKRYREQRGVGKTREWRLKKDYGITLADYDAMLAAQGGVCAICGSPPLDTPRGALSVDHNHATGTVRGLLCNGCNRALGFLSDRADAARAAADYLDRHAGR